MSDDRISVRDVRGIWCCAVCFVWIFQDELYTHRASEWLAAPSEYDVHL